MKKITFVFAFLLSISLFSQKEVRDLDNYSKIKVSGGISVEFYQGDNEAHVHVTKGDLDKLITEVKGETLYIKFEKKSWSWNSGNQKADIKLYGSNNISSVEASAGSYFHSASEFQSEKFYASASSGARAEMPIDASSIKGSASSGGSLELSGEAGRVNFNASSGGSLNAKSLKAEKADAKASSGGSVKLWATDYLGAGASSGGSVKYKGDPSSTNIDVGKYSGGSVSKI